MKKVIEFLKAGKGGSRILVGLLAVVVVSAFVVWPAVADEMVDDSIEVISEEEAEAEESTQAPEPTEEPVVEEPEEKEEPVAEEKQEKDSVIEETPDVEETPEPAAEPVPEEVSEKDEGTSENDTQAEDVQDTSIEESPADDQQQVQDAQSTEQESVSDPDKDVDTAVKKKTIIRPKKRNDGVAVPKPEFSTNPQSAEWNYGSPENGENVLSVEVSNSGDYSVARQWYVDDQKIQEETGKTFTISPQQQCKEEDIDKEYSEYVYFCRVTYTDDDTGATNSEDSAKATIKIKKLPSNKLEYFNYSIPSKPLPYTGEAQESNIPVTSSKEGMGTATIRAKRDGSWAELKDPASYKLFIKVAAGRNYLKDDGIPVSDKDVDVTIEKDSFPSNLDPYTIECDKKGNLKDGSQWYKEPVTIKAPLNYKIKNFNSDDEYTNEFTISDNGKNVGPEKVALKNATTGAIYGPFDVEDISIDTEVPEGSFSFDGTSDKYFKDSAKISVTVTETVSGVDSVKMAYSSADSPNLDRLSWEDVTSTGSDGTYYITVSDLKKGRIYARITDQAGNIKEITSGGVIIDKTTPNITCEGKTIKENGKYIADEKTFTVEDENLSKVTVTQDAPAYTWTYEGDAVKDGTVTFKLDSSGKNKDYTIMATDMADNVTSVTIQMIQPNTDVTITPIDLKIDGKNPVYGYEAGSVMQKLELKPVDTETLGKTPVIDSEDGVVYLEGKNVFTYNPTDQCIYLEGGLGAGDYEAVYRVNYTSANGEIESTTKFTCKVTVDKKEVKVSYAGSSAKYNTIPVFEPSAYEFDGFIEADSADKTKEEIWNDLGLSEKADMMYFDTEGAHSIKNGSKRTTQLGGYPIGPVVEETENYIFLTETTALPEVLSEDTKLSVQREAFEGLMIDGTVGENGWYTSDINVSVMDGYEIAITDDQETKSAIGDAYKYTTEFTPAQYTEQTQDKIVSYYVQNIETGEISTLMTKNFKIDKTAPEGCEIRVADDSFKEFLNTITFGKYFNETKQVTITGSEDISKVEGTADGVKIQYYLSRDSYTEDQIKSVTGWKDYTGKFDLTPEECSKVVVYAKITNDAGLATYCSSDGLVFDNSKPQIEDSGYVGKTERKNVTDYVADELTMTVTDSNLTSVNLYEGTDTTKEGTNLLGEDDSSAQWSVSTATWSKGETKTYTIIAIDIGKNVAKKIFTVTKPIYDITVEDIVLTDVVYGYSVAPSSKIFWKDTSSSNTGATLNSVQLSNTSAFQVEKQEEGKSYIISAKSGLDAGTYTTNVTLYYNDSKQQAVARCSFTVDKAVLTATYLGESVYYNMKPVFDDTTIRVQGFVSNESAEDAAGYKAPTIEFSGVAKETCVLTPANGEADNYDFKYVSGVLSVASKKANKGTDGEYNIEGKLSDTSWYISDITIQPSEGYKISLDEEAKNVEDKIVITKDTNDGQQVFYLMNAETGELFDKTEFSYKKDVVSPVISGVRDGDTYTVNSQNVTVTDDYLANVTVNGEAQPISDGKSSFTLVADEQTKVFVIVASDYAGNKKEASVVLKQPSEAQESKDAGTALTGGTASPDSGTVKKKVQIVQGAPKVAISSSATDTALAVLTKEEQNAVSNGSDANIELKIKSIDGSVSQKDKEAIIASLGGYIVGQYLDITVWKTVGSGDSKQVSETNSKISITITIPESLRNTKSSVSRSFAIFRVHNGAVTKLSDTDSTANTITIRSDKFSTYALAYKDTSTSSSSTTQTKATKKTSTTSSTTSSNGSGASKGATKTSTGSSKKSSGSSGTTTVSTSGGSSSGGSSGGYYYTSSPKTGDTAPLVPVVIVLVAALAGIIVSIILIHKKNNEEAE